MGVISTIREKFSSFSSSSMSGTLAAVKVTSNIARFLIDLTRFESMKDEEIYEQLYVWEPEVGATVNRMAEMAASAFDFFKLKDDAKLDNIPNKIDVDAGIDGQTIDYSSGNINLRNEMLDISNEMAEELNIRQIIETYAALLFIQGEVFLEIKDLALIVIPNSKVTIIDDKRRIGGGGGGDLARVLITEENYLVIDEGLETQRILPKDKFVHLRLNEVPLMVTDAKGRSTFGIYGTSPLHRCVVPIWMKRQLYIIEALWRWANVPREHHKISADAFNLMLYQGTAEQRRKSAEADFRKFADRYASDVKNQEPDSAYITSSNIEISNIEHTASAYMQSNELLKQIDESVWDGLSVPKSVIRGKSDGSYASELVVASGISSRVEQVAKKIGRVLLINMRQRLLKINPQYPVRHLDISISFELAQSRLEKMKQMQILGSLGAFTMTEVRAEGDHPALTDDQKKEGVLIAGKGVMSPDIQTIMNNGGIKGGVSDGSINYPSTPESANQQPTDSAEAVIKKPFKAFE